VIYQISADGVVNIHLEGKLELGADAIHARNQHRIQVLGFVHRKQATKAADFAEHAFGKRLMRQVLDPLLGAIGFVYVDARVGVGDGFGSWGHDAKSIVLRGMLRESLKIVARVDSKNFHSKSVGTA
jgi:hypothetical protein